MSLMSTAALDGLPPVEGVTVWRMPLPAAAARFPVEVFAVSGVVTAVTNGYGVCTGFEMRLSLPVALEAEAAHDLIWRPVAYVQPRSVRGRRDGSWGEATWTVHVLGFTQPEAEDAFSAVCPPVAECLARTAALTSW